MTVEQRKLHPRELASVTETCLWFLKEKVSTPLFTQLDWNMCGSLSRSLKKNSLGKERSLIPTLKRVPSEFIMLESDFNGEEFFKTCSGMKFENVAIVCPSEQKANKIFVELNGHKTTEYPKKVRVFAEEQGNP